MFLVLFVLDDPEKLNDLLDAWEKAGIPGATIMHSSGLGRIRLNGGLRDDMPLIPSLDALFEHEESLSRTLFTVLPDDSYVEKVVQATQHVVGDLSRPHTGFLVVLPVAQVYGLEKRRD